MQDDCCLIGVGPCYIDLMVQIDESFLLKYVNTKKGGDGYCSPEQMDNILAKAGSIAKIVPGGSSANTIRVLSKLRQPCAYLGQVGNDHWGDLFCKNFKELGIELRRKPSSFTPRVLCLISPDGQRTFLALLPQIGDLVLSKEDLHNVKWMHFETRNLISPSFVQRTLKLACELGIKISMDLSSFNIVEEHKEMIVQLISKYAEIVFCNEDEIDALTGLSPEAGCMKLQQLCPIGAVTLGNKGCLIGHQGTLTALPAFPTNVIDTTGAGDYFAAGFLYGYLHNASLEECGVMGIVSVARSLKR